MDYKNFTPDGPKRTDVTRQTNWWDASKTDMPGAVSGVINSIAKAQSTRIAQLERACALYGNVSIFGIGGISGNYRQAASKDRLTYNGIQSATDTVTSKIAKNKPLPQFLTNGGDYKMQRRAIKLSKFVEGVFYENRAHADGPIIFRDAAVCGDGLTYVFERFGRVAHERVMPWELWVDEIEAQHGSPRQIHRRKTMDRQVLLETFPEKQAAIERASAADNIKGGNPETVSDVLTVTESWHLPSGPDAKDGRRIITLDNDWLEIEDWKKPVFPFARMRWCPRMTGYWSQGGAEQVQSIQIEMSKVSWLIQRSIHLSGTFKVWLKTGSKISQEMLNNEIGTILRGDEPPQYMTPPMVQPELYRWFESLKNNLFEQYGISQLSASSQKPPGLDSGRALREMVDIESDRFMTIGQSYEQYFLDLAGLDISVAKDIYDREGKYEVKVPGRKFVNSIDWKDINLEDDEYVMKAYPVSSLPSTPEGRLSTIQEYIQAGFLTPRAGRRLLDFPDLDAAEELANGEEDYIHEIIDKIIDDGEYTPLEPYDDIATAHELGLQYYAQAKCNGLEEEKLDMLRQFIDSTNTMAQAASPPPQAQAAQPQAAPMPQPQSDLVQNVPGQ